jgi:putative intracellular protease/amidase
VVGAVCHGPAALVIVMLDSGEALLVNKQVSGFTNEEGLFLIPSARETFPFLLEDGLAS